MKKILNKQSANLTKQDGVFILYNDSHTIIEEDESLIEAYKKYKILEDKIENKFSNLNLDYNIINKETQGNTSRIKKPLILFFVFFVGIVLYLSYSFDFRGLVKDTFKDVSFELQHTINSTISSIPSTLKNSLMYTSSGEIRCYPCMLEEIIDGIDEVSSEMSPEDMERIRLKIDNLKKIYSD